MSPERSKKKIWIHFRMTLIWVLVFSLVWEFGLAGWVRPSVQSLSDSALVWFNAAIAVGIVLVALLISLPSLMGGVEETTRKTVTELGKTERRYKSIVEATNDMIFQLDGNGIVVFANPAVRLLGYEDGEMVGQFIGDLLYMDNADDVVPRIMTKRIGHRATYHLPIQLRTSPNSVISSEIPAMEFVMDACGLWEETDDKVQSRGQDKTFVGTLCIARPVIKPEDLQPQEDPQESEVYE